ncbi:MAG TPA: LysM peptidoglycan-binding domain-containing protein, partial [Myxococcota bacterium]
MRWWVVSIVCVSLAVVLSACATPGASSRAHDEPAPGRFHTMQPGETVWDVARASGLSVEELVEVNGLPSADDVAAGQVLFVPAGAIDGDVARADDGRERNDAPAGAPREAAATLAWPVDGGVVLRDFSIGKLAYDGLLLAAPEGTVVKAAAEGSVVFAGDQGTAYGIIVVLQHA